MSRTAIRYRRGPLECLMTITKKELARQLKEAASLLEVLGEEPFKVKAYTTAARQIDTFKGDVGALFEADRLAEVPGVGRSIAAELRVLKKRDNIEILDRLYVQVPEGVRSLFMVSGLGAKRIRTLWESGVLDLPSLVEACHSGQVAALRGFGKKTAAAIAQAAEYALESSKRMRLDVAETLMMLLVEGIRQLLPQARVYPAGSLRRALETVGDLDVLLVGVPVDEAQEALAELITFTDSEPPRLQGTFGGREVELQVTEQHALGAALAFWTGGDDFRQAITERAAARGLELAPTGLYQAGERVNTPDEQTFFERIELPFVPPERREWAEPVPVESLITLEDVRGLVHNHSSWSDGAVPLREMVRAARERGYPYLAMADHSQSSAIANGLTIARVLAQAEEVREIRRELQEEGSDFALLHGIEVDILTDGSLDYPDEVLAQLDYTVVSVHQNFSLGIKEQTRRLVRAVQHPYASILGHMTGRLLLRRRAYDVDIQAVIEACAEAGTIIEINANARRLDLDWRWVIKAREAGCRFSINPDAHHPDGFDDVRYGVLMARKSGLTPDDVVNTAPDADAFLRQLKPKPTRG
jgi:DNA polymerase (family 10)